MVAIVSGNGLGVSLSSLSTLGGNVSAGAPTQGRNGELAFVNIANGNLILQDHDAVQTELGAIPLDSLRVYNSQGTVDATDNWSNGFSMQKLVLSGTVNTAGSTIVRTDTDGAQATYSFYGGVYATAQGGGAYDTIVYDTASAQYTRIDSSTGANEKYNAAGRLVLLQDANYNPLTFTYGATGLVTSVADAAGATRTYYDYNASNQLTQIRTLSVANATSTLVHYTYDAAGRLAKVAVDLSPADNSIVDGSTFTTTYAYVGTTKQLQSVTQSDGSSLTFAYVAGDPTFRMQSVTDAIGNKTSFSYDATNRKTTVTDANGQASVYSYDATGQLLSVAVPSAAGTATTSYAYNANGDLAQLTDPSGRTIVMGYDVNGNQISQMDAAGNTVTRTFDGNKQLLTETAYVVPDPDGAGTGQASQPMTTRYVYDASGWDELRFVISPEGRVTQYVYNDYNERAATIQYASSAYAVGGLAATAVPTEAQMVAWVGTQDLTKSVRTDVAYNAVGMATQSVTYAKVDVSGNGVIDGTQSTTTYVYDQYGHLLQLVKPGAGATTFTYDGLGRVLTKQDANGTATNVYDDVNGKTVATAVNGLITTSTYDKGGRLVSMVQGTSSVPNLGTTTNAYDADGNLLMTTDPDGNRTFSLYDAARRKVATIDATGFLTETVYNPAGQPVETIRYATAANLALLVDGTGKALNPALSAVRPAGTSYVSWTLYDAAGRVSKQVDAAGYVTETRYDGASRVTDVVRYATAVAVGGISTTTLAAAVVPAADAVNDRLSRTFYDNDGNVTGTLDAEGYLTENVYDSAGRLVHAIRYATATASASRAAGTLATLRPVADNTHDIHAWNYYNDENQLIGSVDGEGYLTEYVYDAGYHVVKTTRHAALALLAPTAIVTTTTLAALRPTGTTGDRVSQASYNGLGQLASTTNAEGTITQYAYDNVGNLLTTTVAATTTDVRTETRKYDVQGRLLSDLGGVGSAALAALGATPTPAQIATVWTTYATSYAYDADGLRTSATDPVGNKTLYYYDADGRATHTINALGEVQEATYNVLGQVVATTKIGTRLTSAVLTTLTGGIDTAALLSAITTAKSATLDSKVSYTYLAQGVVNTQTDALGDLTTYSYNAFGQSTLATQAIGGGANVVHKVDYDRRGLVKDTQENSADELTSFVYDAFGRAVSTTDPKGNLTSTTFDRLGRATLVTGPLFVSGQSTFDAFGRALTVKDANGNATTYVYDDVARTMKVTDLYNVTVTRTHDREGETIAIVDGDGHTTTYAYDTDGHLKDTITDPGLGGLALDSHTDYDAAGRIADTVDASGNKVTYTYDAANRVFKRTEGANAAMNIVTTYTYDPKGQLVTQQDPDGVLTGITYDFGGNVLTKTVDTASLKLKTTNTYDVRGNLLTSTDPSGVVTTYAYNAIGRRISQQVDTTLKLTTQYGYDGDGNVTRQIDPDGNVTLNAYDKAGRLIYSQDGANNVTGYAYDNDGHVLTATSYAKVQASLAAVATANGTVNITVTLPTPTTGLDQTTTYTYDTNGRKTLAEVDKAGLDLKTQYFYDGAGNVTKVVDPNGAATLYIYDAANRVTSTLSPAGTLTNTAYDGDGHVTQTTVYSGAKAMTTSVATNGRVTNAISGTLTSSPNDLVTSYTYDAANRRKTATVDPNGLALKTQYAYDAAGNLTQVTDPAGKITYFGYDAAGRQRYVLDPQNLLTETVYDGANRITATIVYASVQASPSATPNAAGLVTPIFTVVGSAALDRITRYAYDAAGRQVYAVDALGAVTETAYDAASLVTGVRRYATLIALPTVGAADGRTLAMSTTAIKAAISSSAADLITSYAYDAAGRKVFSVDAFGAVSGYTYDAFDQLAIKRQYANTVTQPAWGTAFTAAAITTALGAANPADRLTRFGYDNAGRTLYAVDALGVVTSSVYDLDSRVIKTQVYHAAILLPTDGSALTGAAIALKLAAAAGTDAVTRYAYDADGHQVYAVDAMGFVTATTYDLQGRVRAKTVYAAPATLPTTAGATMTATDIAAALYPSPTTDQVTRYVVDDAGNVTWVVDPLGHIVAYSYDKDGNVTSKKEYSAATTTNLSALPLIIGPTDFVVTVNAATDRATRYFYDGDNRLRFEIDPLGYVTETAYQADRTVTTQYAAMPGTTSAVTTADVATAVAAVANVANDHATTVLQDKDGRLTDTTTPDGVVARDVYDVLGRVVTHIDAVGRPEQLTTGYVYDAAGRVKSKTVGQGSAAAQTALTTYNAFGNVDTVVSPDGYALANLDTAWAQAERVRLGMPTTSAGLSVAQRADMLARYTTKFTYDLDGRALTTTTSYGSTSATSTSTSTKYDAFGNAVKVVDPLGNAGYFYFDKLGRVIMQVDPLLNVVQTSYTGGFSDKVASVRRYVNKAAAGTNETAAPAPTTNALDVLTTYAYDKLGRVVSTVNASGTADQTTESVAWQDATGNIFNKVVTNKLGGAANYVYDRDGQELSETLPVLVGTTAVKNTYQYDAFGNRVQSVEAAGLPEVRTTTYRYDAMGRVTYRIGTAYTAFDAAAQASSTVTPVDWTIYDALGRITETRTSASWTAATGTASGGVRTVNYFDVVGNNTMTVAADGGATVRTFTASGKAASVSKLINPVILAAGDPPPMPALPALTPYDRTATYTYDVLDRLVQTGLSNLVTWTATYTNGTLNSALAATPAVPTPTQILRYDAAGNVVQETDGRGASTYSYYDALGRTVLQIDPSGYVTSWTFGDLFDKPTQVTKYATKLTSYARQDDTTAAAAQRDPSLLLAAVTRTQDDRITDYVYDRQGRVQEQRVEAVAYDYVDATGARLIGKTAALTDFTYDGLGDVRHKQVLVALKADSTQIWDATDFTYDALGRQTSELDPTFVDVAGQSVRSGSTIVYDGLGNRHTEALTGNTSTGGDATTIFGYDVNGNLASQTDANNYLTTFDYDALGRVSRSTLHGDPDATGATRDVVKLYQYDAMGRQTVETTLGTADARNARYDVFGDITDKGLGAGAFQEHATYNVLGKVERSNSGDGAWKVYLYDVNGNVTRQMSANIGGVDLSTMSLQDAAVNTSVNSTYSVYDERNELVNTVTQSISYQEDAASMAAAYTQTLTALQGPITLGSGGQGASGGVAGASYTAVGNGSGSTGIGYATPNISGSNALTGLTTPSSTTANAVNMTQLAVDCNVSNGRSFLPYLAAIKSFYLPGTGYSLGSSGQLSGGFPSTWQYQVLNSTGGLVGSVVPGGSVAIPSNGSTLSLQARIPGGSWMEIGTITNLHTQGAGESENDFDCTLSVSRIVTSSGRVEAFTNYGTANQVALSVGSIPGTNSYMIGSAAYGTPNPNVVTIITSGETGMAEAQNITFNATTGPSVAAPLVKADVWVSGAGATTLEFGAPIVNHVPPGFVGPWVTSPIFYRTLGSASWQSISGPWTGSSEAINANSLAPGNYEYLIASGPSGERYGVFQVTASHGIVLATLSGGTVNWTGAGMANSIAAGAFSSSVAFGFAANSLALVNGVSGTYTMTLTAGSTTLSQSLDGNLSTSFDMHSFAPFASVSRMSSASSGYHYVVTFTGSDGFQRFVGEGDGTLALGGSVDGVSGPSGSASTPLATLTLAGVASPSATVTLNGGGKQMVLNMSDPRIIRTVGSNSTTIVVNFSDYLGCNPVQLTYSGPDAQSSGTYSVGAYGAVSCSAFSTLVHQPLVTLNIPGATAMKVFNAGANDTSLTDARGQVSGGNGLFTWDASGLIGKNASRFYYQAVNAQNVVVGQGYGSITISPDGTTANYAFDTPQVKPAILTLTPTLAADNLVLSVRPHGSAAAWQQVQQFTNVAANAQIAYDASAWRSDAGDVALDYQFVGTTGGQKVLGGNGWFTVQSNGNIVNNANNTDRAPIVLNGPQGEHVPFLKVALTIPGPPPSVVTQVIPGVWSDSLYCTTFTWDVTPYQPSNGTPLTYPITLTMVNDSAGASNYTNSVGQTIAISGQLVLGGASSGQPVIQQWTKGLSVSAQINRHQSFNAFGQVASEWDDATAANADKAGLLFGVTPDKSQLQTTSVYNTLGVLVQKIDPQTTVVGENGMRVRARPVTTYGYDLEGRVNTVQDANGQLSRQNYVGGGDNVSQQWAADNGSKTTKYDILGHVRDVKDELGFETVQTRDKLGNLTEADQLNVTRTNAAAVTLTDLYHYDAEGHRIWHRNAANTVDETFYDNLDRVISTSVDATGANPYLTKYEYAFVPQGQTVGITGLGDDGHAPSIGGYQLKTTGIDGRFTLDNVNYFGTTTWHQDEGGHAFQYVYDYGGHLARQTGTTGQEIDYQYYGNGALKEAKDVSPTDLTLTRYGYDNAGNRTWEQYTGLDASHTGPTTQYQSSTIVYDELGRMIQVKDAEVTAVYEYDAVGNRRTVDAVYQDPLSGVMQHDTFWYTYDATNRFTLTKGSYAGNRLDGSGHIVQGAQGVAITYDQRGQRTTALDATDGVLQTYVYSTDGFLEDTQFGTIPTLGARRLIDNLGRTAEYLTYTTTGASVGTVTGHQTSSYDVLGRMRQATDLMASTTSTYYYFSDTTDTAASLTGHGALARVDQGPSAGGVNATTSYTYGYWDDAKETKITVSSTGGNVRTGTSYLYYDDDGFLSSATDMSTSHVMTYVNSSNGLVLRRTQTGGDTGPVPVLHEYFYATGRMIGDVSTRHSDNASRISYVEELAQSAPGGKVDQGSYLKNAPSSAGSSNARSVADFDENYQPINSSYPAAVATNYTVRGGDTLRSIAQAMWGDSQMWYLIAQANNLSGTETLAAGQLLVIPNKVTNIHNNSTTFRPYNPGEVIGHIDPTLPAPPPPASGGKGCGTIGTIIMVVVAIVATIYTAGAAAELLVAEMSASAAAAAGATTAGLAVAASSSTFALGASVLAGTAGLGGLGVAAAVVGGAVGSIASQAIGDAMGNTHGFSWKQVAVSAIASGVTAGVGEGLNAAFPAVNAAPAANAAALTPGQAFTQGAERFGMGVATSVGSSAVEQALKGEWSWRQIAASAVGSAAGQAAGGVMGDVLGNSSYAQIATRTISGMANGWASSQVLATDPRYSKAKTGALFISSLGNALGEAAADYLAKSGGASVQDSSSGGDRKGADIQRDQAGNAPSPGVNDSAYSLANGLPKSGFNVKAPSDWGPPGLSDYDLNRTQLAVSMALLSSDMTAAPGTSNGGAADASAADPLHHIVQPGENPALLGRLFFGDERAGGLILARNGFDVSVHGARTLPVGYDLTIPSSINSLQLQGGGQLIAADSAVRTTAATVAAAQQAVASAAPTPSAAPGGVCYAPKYGTPEWIAGLTPEQFKAYQAEPKFEASAPPPPAVTNILNEPDQPLERQIAQGIDTAIVVPTVSTANLVASTFYHSYNGTTALMEGDYDGALSHGGSLALNFGLALVPGVISKLTPETTALSNELYASMRSADQLKATVWSLDVGSADLSAASKFSLEMAPNYMQKVSDFTGRSFASIGETYGNLRTIGADYESLIGGAVDKYGLSVDQAHSVFGYTTNIFYRNLNETLNNGGSTSANALASLLDSGLELMPSAAPGLQFRGLRLNSDERIAAFDADFKVGNTVETKSFWSTGPSPDNSYSGARQLVIDTEDAKDISDLAFGVHFHNLVGKPSYTSETIIAPGTLFNVKSETKDGLGRLLQQAPPSGPN